MNMLKRDESNEAAPMSIGHFARTRVSFNIIEVVGFPLNVSHLKDIGAAAGDRRCGQCMKAKRSVPFSRVHNVVLRGQLLIISSFFRRPYASLSLIPQLKVAPPRLFPSRSPFLPFHLLLYVNPLHMSFVLSLYYREMTV